MRVRSVATMFQWYTLFRIFSKFSLVPDCSVCGKTYFTEAQSKDTIGVEELVLDYQKFTNLITSLFASWLQHASASVSMAFKYGILLSTYWHLSMLSIYAHPKCVYIFFKDLTLLVFTNISKWSIIQDAIVDSSKNEFFIAWAEDLRSGEFKVISPAIERGREIEKCSSFIYVKSVCFHINRMRWLSAHKSWK